MALNAGEEDDPDLRLSVPLQPLYEEFCCPICFGTIRDCYMTPCGHNFCAGCIEECLNRKHVCPVCNQAVSAPTIKNHHFDRFIAVVQTAKERASSAHFERLISLRHSAGENAAVAAAATATATAPQKRLSPIEEVFHAHMKRFLAAYGEYELDLLKRREAAEARVRAEFATRVAAAHSAMQQRQAQQPGSVEMGKAEATLAGLSRECDEELARIAAEHEGSMRMLTEGYDRLLEELIPDPSLLPVTVSIVFPRRNLRVQKLVLKPVDHLDDVKRRFAEAVERLGDPIVKWGEDVVFKVPSAAPPLVLGDPTTAVHQWRLAPGMELVIEGTVQFKSELPQECFSASYSKDKPDVRMDYFTCVDCRTNWICKPCADQCHKGHKIVPYILNHRPSFGCCYCPRQNLCKIVNSRTKR